MRDKFKDVFHGFTLPHEGGTNFHVLDRGGETKYGICKKQYPDIDISNLTLDQAEKIYKRDYWEKNKCNNFAYPLATALFDSSVNCGVYSGAIWLQKSINKIIPNTLKVDGVIGSQTLAYAEAFPPYDLAGKIIAFRLQRYAKIVEKNPEQRVFVLGWMKRASDLLLFI